MSLEINNVNKKFGKKTVVENVSLKLNAGEVVGLLGVNGAGKTTTFYIIAGLLFPTTGNVLLDENDITHDSLSQRAKKGLIYLPQESSLFQKLTVEENIMAILEFLPLTKEKCREKLEAVLSQFSLEKHRKTPAYALSGGEKRKTEIARTLVSNPRYLLFDEPFAGVDPMAVNEIQLLINSLSKKNIGILITDHNVRETLQTTDRTYIMNEGKIIIQGTPQQIINSDIARQHYLGDNFNF